MTTFNEAATFFNNHPLSTYRRVGAKIPSLTDPGTEEGVAIRLARAMGLLHAASDALNVENKALYPAAITEMLDDCGYAFQEGRVLHELLYGVPDES